MSEFNSTKYWQDRYSKGGNSGAGSYNHLAEFKAKVINSFVENNPVETVAEFGCGDGNQLTMYKFKKYFGFDVSEDCVKYCQEMFKDKPEFTFKDKPNDCLLVDLTMSIDVIYHLVEDEVYHKYMTDLFNCSDKFVVIYSSNHTDNDGSAQWVRHRKFTNWIRQNASEFVLINQIANPFPYSKGLAPRQARKTSVSNFYFYKRVK